MIKKGEIIEYCKKTGKLKIKTTQRRIIQTTVCLFRNIELCHIYGDYAFTASKPTVKELSTVLERLDNHNYNVSIYIVFQSFFYNGDVQILFFNFFEKYEDIVDRSNKIQEENKIIYRRVQKFNNGFNKDSIKVVAEGTFLELYIRYQNDDSCLHESDVDINNIKYSYHYEYLIDDKWVLCEELDFHF